MSGSRSLVDLELPELPEGVGERRRIVSDVIRAVAWA